MGTIIHSRFKNMSVPLPVTDTERSIDFYTKILGFTIEFRYDDFYCGIRKDDFSIHLKSGKPSAEERKNRRDKEDPDIIFSVDNIEELHENLSINTVEFIQRLREMPYGKEFYIAGPDGYIIAFLSAGENH